MADPELHSDEKVLLRTQGVYVKSIPFEGILTNRRIILVDRAKNLLPPKEIPLGTIRDTEPGENAIRDQIITLSVTAKTGETRQMILTFSRQAGGNRIKERDAWVRLIKEHAVPAPAQIVRRVVPEPEMVIRRSEQAPKSRYEVVRTPARAAPPATETPVRRASQPSPAPAPLPATMFCSKCGNRVPAESAFCNRCGSPIARVSPAPAASAGPVATSREAPLAPVPAPVQPAPPAHAFPAAPEPEQEPVPVTPTQAAVVKAPASRPIDEEIRSIEPLIERSTENIPNDALSSEPVKNPFEEPVELDDQEKAGEEVFAPAPAPVSPVSWPAAAAPASVPPAETPDTPLPPRPPRGMNRLPGKKAVVTGAVAVFIILLVAAGAFLVLPMFGGGDTGDTAKVTPVPTTSAPFTPSGTTTIKERPPVTIPQTGVYVHVNYLGGFKGSYGMTDMETTVPGNSGDRVWEVENASGTVDASFEKLDGSSHELIVELYKNGKLLSSGSTTVGHGSVTLSVNATTGVASPPVTSGTGSAAKTSVTPVSSPVITTAAPETTGTTSPP